MSATITAYADPYSSPPSVAVSVSSSTPTAVVLTRFVNGAASGTVRTSDGLPLPVNGTATVVDYEAPIGRPVSYQAGITDALSDPVVLDVTVPWLVHLARHELSVPLTLRPGTLQQETRALSVGTFYPVGRSRPITVTDGARRSVSSSLVAMTEDEAALQRFLDLLADGSVLMLNLPTSMATQFPACYIQVDDLTVARWDPSVIDANRDLTLPFVVVDPPVSGMGVWLPGPAGGTGSVGSSGGGTGTGTGTGNTGGTGSWSSILVRGTWADVALADPTWADVLTDAQKVH